MSAAIPVLAAVGIIISVLAVWRLGLYRAAIVAFIVALALIPWRLIPVDVWHVGITDPILTPTTYNLAVILFLGITLMHPPRRSPWWWYAAALPGYLLVWMGIFWQGTSEQWSGLVHLAVAGLALVLGSLVSPRIAGSPELERTLVVTVTLVIGLQLVVSLIQLSGFPLSVYGDIGRYLSDGRPVGTFNHPTTPGKIIALLQLPLMMATVSTKAGTRRWAWVGLALGLPATAVTQSRANLAAVVLGLALWILLGHKDEIRRRVKVAVLAAGAIAAVPLSASALARFGADPFGGDRTMLMNSALEQIARSPWAGTGPNSYVEVVGGYDPVVATGVPVHVSILLVVAELGVLGALLFFAPWVWISVQSVRPSLSPDGRTAAARAIIATLPGIIIIALTGWGVVADNVLLLWWFVLGYANAQSRKVNEFPPIRSEIPWRRQAMRAIR